MGIASVCLSVCWKKKIFSFVSYSPCSPWALETIYCPFPLALEDGAVDPLGDLQQSLSGIDSISPSAW